MLNVSRRGVSRAGRRSKLGLWLGDGGGISLRGARWAALLLLIFVVGGSVSHAARAASAAPAITIHTDELAAGPPFMGLGVQWDPYDSFQPTPAQWNLTFQRLDYMRPGFIRVVEPASDYFGGYDAAHDPVYRWTARHVVQLRTILDYAQEPRDHGGARRLVEPDDQRRSRGSRRASWSSFMTSTATPTSGTTT